MYSEKCIMELIYILVYDDCCEDLKGFFYQWKNDSKLKYIEYRQIQQKFLFIRFFKKYITIL